MRLSFAPNAASQSGIFEEMSDPHSHLLKRMRVTLEEMEQGLNEMEQGLKFSPDAAAAERFREFLLGAIAELEWEQMMDLAA